MKPERTNKKTIYVDVDEEITSVIDKVRSAGDTIVALVLPRRATVFQSVVNMKLLKRAADQDNKKVVLITSEPGLLPLAGAVGLHVAPNLNSKPHVPAAPAVPEPKKELNAHDNEIDPTTTIGSVMAKGTSAPSSTSEEPIQIDNAPKAAAAASISEAAKEAKKKKGGKKLSVPDFKKFRVLMIAGVALLIALIGFGYWAIAVAPKATVTLRGETSEADLSYSIIADTDATELDEEELAVPARQLENKKSEVEKVPASGQKDLGAKAGGTVTIRNCSDDAITIPAGTGVSSGNLTYITQSSVRLDEGEFSSQAQCRPNGDHVGTVSVVAQSNGEQYNAPERSYSVSGFSQVSAQGEAMTGGSSKIAKVVAPQDIETAKQRLAERQQAVKAEMTKSLQADGFVALPDTFVAEVPAFTPTPALDSEATEVTVTAETTYRMLGVDEDDLKKTIELQADKDESIDTAKQSILDDGLGTARFVIGAKRGTATDVTIETKVVAGPEIDEQALAAEIAGKKRGEAEQTLKSRPGISEARVDTSPFWNFSVPKKESKVKFVIEESDGSVITR